MDVTEAAHLLLGKRAFEVPPEYIAENSSAILAVLMPLYAEQLRAAEALADEHIPRLQFLEQMGREGRKMLSLASDAYEQKCAPIRKEMLRLERAFERVGRITALVDAESIYRERLGESLLAAIRLHKEAWDKGLGEEANARLWASIEE